MRDPAARHTALLLIHDLVPGGAEQVFLTYLSRLNDVRAVPVLVRPLGSLLTRIPDGIAVHHLDEDGGRVMPAAAGLHVPAPARRPAEGFWREAVSLLVKSRRLAGITRVEGASVVSTFLHKSHVIALVAKLLWVKRLRVVVNVHEQPTQHLATHFHGARRFLMRAFYQRLLPKADRVVVVSDAVGSELVDRYGTPPELIVVVRNPVDASELRARAGRGAPVGELPDGTGPLLVGVGRLVAIKGFDLLISAMPRIRRHFAARLIVIGDGPERDRLHRLVDSLGLDDAVELLGYRENPMPYLAKADLLVVPSRTEAWPTVIVEAMAVNTAVLAANCSPGVAELLGDGEFGALVEPEDVGALAAKVVDLLSCRDSLEHLAMRGSRRIEDFEPVAQVARYEAALCGGDTRFPLAGR